MTVKSAKIVLTALWGVGAIPLLSILVLRQLNGFYGDQAQAAWSWAAQFLFPNLTLIGGAWSVAASPDEDKPLGSSIVFWGAVVASAFYLAVLYVVLGAHASGSMRSSLEQSGLFLGLIQALVVGWLGKFFIEAKH
jgi:hypothetical protein